MQKNKRLRIFAGPNGSGKSTLFKEFKTLYNPGYFINADELEKSLSNSGLIDLTEIGLKATQKDLENFKKTKTAKSLITKASEEGKSIDIEVKENYIVDKAKNTHSYEASFAASFIRDLLYKNSKSFSFETVMSHSSKLKEIGEAKNKGYKIYLYFICTDNPEINISRVENRVDKGGHYVETEKIRSRYPNTLKNLYPAIKLSDRVYLFDNSAKKQELIAEIFEGVLQLKTDKLPNWFMDYVITYYA
jgi:predicted ABC-type ATPase